MEKYDIIIQGGQSNAEGCGVGETENPYIPSADVLYMDVEKQIETTAEYMIITYPNSPFLIHQAQERGETEKYADFSLRFAEKYKENGCLKDGRKLLIIRAAIGGSGFKKGQWGLNAPVYLKMLEMTEYALSLNPENKIVAFLWHQGEHDAFEKNDPDIFKTELKACIEEVRRRFGYMPFITADFVNEWKSKNLEICEPIVDKIKEVTKEVGYSAFIETSDLPSNNQKTGNGDDIHFCRNSLRILGERYFNAFEKLVK